MHNQGASASLAGDGEHEIHISDGKRRLSKPYSQHDHDSSASGCSIRFPTFRACLLASVMLVVTLVEAQDAPEGAQSLSQLSPGCLHVEINDDLLSAKAHGVTIMDLVAEISRQTGLALVSYDPLEEHVTVEIDKLSLPKALLQILNGKSFALQHTRRLSRTWSMSRERANTLWVLPQELGDYPRREMIANQISSVKSSIAEASQDELKNAGNRPEQEAVNDMTDVGAQELKRRLALADEDVNVRIETIHALADVGGDQAVAALVGALGDEDVRVRAEAAHALGEIGDDSIIEILEQSIYDADKHVRHAAVDAFTDIGGDRAARALATALQDSDASLRQAAIIALGEIGGPVAIQILGQTFQDRENKVREAAIDALITIGGDDTAEALATTLRDETALLRIDAVYALGEIGGETAMALLQQALEDREPSIREAAAEMLNDLLSRPH